MRWTKLLSLAILILIGVSSGVVLSESEVNAADARNYNAGKIIDDSVFTNKNSMSAQDIQNFLNSKVNCDTWGQKQSELGGGTRAQWMNARGIYAPFRCVTDYKENPANGQNNYSKNDTPAGAISAAQIIYNYSQQFNINPQVLIVTLQKENGMITDEWPTPKQFSESMGFGCPDNVAPGAPACDASYGSFATQIYQAARHFRGYIDKSAGWWVPFNTGWNSIAYNPSSSCGRGDVYIENRSTVALYSYTPYQPNQAAKNAQYGGGDSCSAYGNRNFYLYFTDWFGSTSADVSITSALRITSGHSVGLYTKVPTTVSFDIKNNRSYPIGIGSMTVSVRDSQGRNLDYALQPIYLPAYASATFSSSQILPQEETYTFSIVNFSEGAWKSDYPTSSNVSNVREQSRAVMEMPTQNSSITIGNELRSGKDTPVSFTVKNNSATSSVDAGKFAIAVRGPRGENFDLPLDSVVLSPNQTYTYTKVFRPPYEGSYRFFVVSTLNNSATWESNFPLPLNETIANVLDTNIKPGVTTTQSLQSSSSDAHAGQNVTLFFKVRNLGSSSANLGKLAISGRDPLGRNIDPGIANVVLAAGEERTISFNSLLTLPGQYKYSIISTADNGITWGDGQLGETDVIGKTLTFNAKAGVTVNDSLKVTQTNLHAGESSTVSFKVKNYGDSSVNLGKLAISGRDPANQNVDPGIVTVTLAAGEERVISFPSTFSTTGTYRFGIVQTTDSGVTWTSGPEMDSGLVTGEASISVKPPVTVTSGLDNSLSSMSVGQSSTLSFTVKNYGTNSANLGKLGIMGRSPIGENVDPGIAPITLAAGEQRVISFAFNPSRQGSYLFSLLGTLDSGATWNDGPTLESNVQQSSINVTVR